MSAKVYSWPNSASRGSIKKWRAIHEGVFVADGATSLGTRPRYAIWSGAVALVSISRCRTAALVRIPRPLRGKLLDQLGFRFVLKGALRIGQAGETVAAGRVARAGESVLIDLAQPLHLEYSSDETDTVELTLWVGRTHATRAFADLGSLHGAILRSDVPGASVLGAAAQALHSELDRLSAGEIDQLGGGLFDLAARILARVEAKTSASPELESFATICRYVEAHLMARDLGAEKLARTFGLSRASLYRLFEPVGGVASYVRARRLNRARQQLQTAGLDDRRIGPIAYQSGFRSVTAFNRAFREAYGHTPRDVRRSRFDPSASISTEPANVGILARSLFAITV